MTELISSAQTGKTVDDVTEANCGILKPALHPRGTQLAQVIRMRTSQHRYAMLHSEMLAALWYEHFFASFVGFLHRLLPICAWR